MKKIFLLLLLITTIGFSQRPGEEGWNPYENGPGSEGWGSTAETVEDCYESWTFYSSLGNCIHPSEYLCNNYWSFGDNSVSIDIQDTYELCCITASTIGFVTYEGGLCEEFVTSLNVDEYKINHDNLYYDIYGRRYKNIPNGFSIKNQKKYIKI